MTGPADYYFVLGIPPQASVAEVRAAYRHKARQCHPDMGGTQDQIITVIEAWEVLSDPRKRELYDRARSGAADASAQAAWETVSQQASAAATAKAGEHAASRQEFSAWIDSISADVQSRRSGRLPAGAAAGVMVGCLVGIFAGPAMGVGAWAGVIVGALAGATGGAYAAASSRSAAAKT